MRDRCRCGEAECSRSSGTIPIDEGYLYDDNQHGLVWPPNRITLIKLTGICWHWREILINTSNFWTRIDPHISLSPNLLELWTIRSKGSRLDVFVFPNTDFGHDSFIMKNINRIENLQLLNHGDFSFVPPNTHAPILRSLSINLFYKDNTLGPIDLALNVPLLDNVCLNNITLRPSSYALFNNVRRLALTQTSSRPFEEMTIETVLQILTHCQLTLDELEVRTTGPHDPRLFSGKTPNSILVLLRLRRLVWKTRSISPSLLSLIAAPALQTLHIVMEQTNVVEDFSQLIPVSIVQLSEWSPMLLHAYRAYRNFTPSFGINLYADPSGDNKLFAFSFTANWVGGLFGYDDRFQAFFKIFFETFIKAHNLSTLRYTMLTDIPVDLVQNAYQLIPEMNVKVKSIDVYHGTWVR